MQSPRCRTAVLAGAGRLLIALTLLGSLVGGVVLTDVLGRPAAARVAGPPPEPEIEPAPVPPGDSAPPAERPLPPVEESGIDPVRAWADQIAVVVDVPARAVVSYVNADLAMREYQPGCGLSWATLAGIGRIESNHGRYGGAVLGEDGRTSEAITGVPLDGAPGIRVVPDTDGGQWDGDTEHDRAIGPMQFIPSTWRNWTTDGNGDGIGDPHNLDDAAMAAARYLCAGDKDLTSGDGWWSAVLSYNNSVEYGQKVFALAESYAEAGRRVG